MNTVPSEQALPPAPTHSHTHPAPRLCLHTQPSHLWLVHVLVLISLPGTRPPIPSHHLSSSGPLLSFLLSSQRPLPQGSPPGRTPGACLLLCPPPPPGTSPVCSDRVSPVIVGFLSASTLVCRLQEGSRESLFCPPLAPHRQSSAPRTQLACHKCSWHKDSSPRPMSCTTKLTHQ